MTLLGIMKLALRQLDEAAEDLSEYDELFRSYANMGYMIAVRLFLRPRECFEIATDEEGRAEIRALPLGRIIELRDKAGFDVPFDVEADGAHIRTGRRNEKLRAVCEIEAEEMSGETDVPVLPEYAHPALADYICYRHLSSGNLAKQSRAQFFYQSFYQQMRALRPQGAESVTRMKNLYAVTGAGYRG